MIMKKSSPTNMKCHLIYLVSGFLYIYHSVESNLDSNVMF